MGFIDRLLGRNGTPVDSDTVVKRMAAEPSGQRLRVRRCRKHDRRQDARTTALSLQGDGGGGVREAQEGAGRHILSVPDAVRAGVLLARRRAREDDG